MVQQTARRGDQDVDTVGEPLGLGRAVAATHEQAKRVHVVRHELLQHAVRLHGQLPCWRKDQHTSSWMVGGLGGHVLHWDAFRNPFT